MQLLHMVEIIHRMVKMQVRLKAKQTAVKTGCCMKVILSAMCFLKQSFIEKIISNSYSRSKCLQQSHGLTTNIIRQSVYGGTLIYTVFKCYFMVYLG